MSGLSFNSLTGVRVQDTATIRANIVTKVQQAFKVSDSDPLLNLDPASPMGQVVDLLVAEIEAKNAEIAYLSNMLNLSSARGVWLDALGSLYFIERKMSEPTTVTCEVTGISGTVVPYGSLVEDANGNKLRLLATEGITISADGTGSGQFSTVEHGAIVINSHSVTKIITVVAGWDTVDNASAGVTGRDRETDAEYLARIKISLANNAQGTIEAIRADVLALDGVIACTVLENITNQSVTSYGVQLTSHSIGVCVYGGNDEDIAKAIYKKKDAGCGTSGTDTVTYTDPEYPDETYEYKIFRATAERVYIKITSYQKISDEVQATLKEAILADFNGEGSNARATMAQTLYASRFFYVAQSLTSVVLQKATLSVDGSTYSDSLVINANQMPTLQATDITFETVS